MQIALWQPGTGPCSRERALDALGRAAAAAAAAGADWLLAPEFTVPAVTDPRALAGSAEPSDGPFARGVAAVARRLRLGIAVGYPESAFGHLFSAALVVDDRGIAVGHYRRVHLYPEERQLLSPGQWQTLAPAGGIRIGVLLGADLTMPEAARTLVLSGASLLFCLGTPAVRAPAVAALGAARAIENATAVAVAGFEGGPAGLFDPERADVSRPGPVAGLRLARWSVTGPASLPCRRPELYRILCAEHAAEASVERP